MRKRTIKDNLKLKGGKRGLKSVPRNEIYVVLDNIRSMYNIGSIFRTSEAVRVKKIYLCGICAVPPREQISKTSLGACDRVPWEYVKKATDAVKELKKLGVNVIALEQTDSSVDFTQALYTKPVAIILGHELKGVSKAVLELCDQTVEIPMLGFANSLNVATAAGVILYNVLMAVTNIKKP